MSADRDRTKKYATAEQIGSGPAVVVYWFAPEHGGYWEPWSVVFSSMPSMFEADEAAKEFAAAEGIEYESYKGG